MKDARFIDKGKKLELMACMMSLSLRKGLKDEYLEQMKKYKEEIEKIMKKKEGK